MGNENMETEVEYETIEFETEDGVESFYVLDDTKINGINYILVTDSNVEDDDEEMEVMILKEILDETDEELSTFETVEDEEELATVAKLFEESLGDIDIEL